MPEAGGRRATPADFGSQIGGAIESYGSALKEVHDTVQESEIRTAVVGTAQIHAKYAQRLDEAAVNGADLEKIRQEMNDELSKVGENFATIGGQAKLQVDTANTNIMYDQQANSIKIKRAGAEARLGAEKLLTSASRIMRSNPSYLPTAEQSVNDFVSTLQMVPIEQRNEIALKLKQNMNVESAMSLARLDPQDALSRSAAGDWDLSPDQRDQVESAAHREIAGQRTDADRLKKQAKDELEAQREVTRNNILDGIVDKTTTARYILDSNLEAAGEGSKATYLAMLKDSVKAGAHEIKTNPNVFMSFLSKIRNNEITSATVFDERARTHQDLEYSDVLKLRKEYADMLTPDGKELGDTKDKFIKAVTPQIDKSNWMMGFVNQTGREQIFRMEAYMNRRIQEKREKKESAYDLFDPAHRDYLGNSVYMFQTTIAESAQQLNRQTGNPAVVPPVIKPLPGDNAPAPTPLAPALRRRPNESIQDYDKRIKGGK